MWLWGPAWCSFMFGLTFLHLLICFAAWCATMFLSHHSGLVAVYMTKLDSWGVHMWGCVGRDLDVVPCWWSLCMCVGVFLWQRSGVSSPPTGGGVGSYCASFGMTAQRSSWGTCGFSARCHAAGYPSGVPHLADSGWLASSCSGGFAWGWGCLATGVLFPHFGFLPCASAAPPSDAPPSGFCALAGCVSMSASCLLVYSWGCAGRVFAVPLGFSPMCHALPQGLQRELLSLMQVQMRFSGHWVSVLLLPW